MSEIGQGSYLQEYRKCHPLDFISSVVRKTYIIITEMSSRHTIWRQQGHLNATRNLVPHGLKLFLQRSSNAASKVQSYENGQWWPSGIFCSRIWCTPVRADSSYGEQDMFLWDMASISISVPLCNCCCIEAGTVC